MNAGRQDQNESVSQPVESVSQPEDGWDSRPYLAPEQARGRSCPHSFVFLRGFA